jgi:UDP-galactopyranose mutase
MKTDWLIVGAGFTGCTLAERIATQLNQKVLLVDHRSHIGGNAHDHYNDAGLLVHKYGPHIFHTNSVRVWDYLSGFTQWRPYYHQVLGVVEGQRVPVPFNLNSLHQLFPAKFAARMEDALLDHYAFGSKVPILELQQHSNPDLKFLAKYVYQNVFLHYTVKQWGRRPEELDPSVTARVPIHISRDNRYFQDKYQAMPAAGYTAMFQRMLNHPNIQIMLQTPYESIANEISCERMIYTGAMDEFFSYVHGPLPYRSIRFDFEVVDAASFQETGTVNYPNDQAFTRITDLKYLTGQQVQKTTIVREYPCEHVPGLTEPYYPVPDPQSAALYGRYLREAKKLNGRVIFSGRLADYKYYNMDQAVARALKVFEHQVAGADSRIGELQAAG